jgi:phospholipid/cholesterol/gamma-HCH transport system substrate-binding protein
MIGTGQLVTPARVLSVAALVIAVSLLVLLFSGGSGYTINARFVNASQLVRGDSVDLGGRAVGSVTGISVTPDGQANIVLSIDDSRVTPLHVGTTASIRAYGQAGVANHFVLLSLGPASAPRLADGAVLPTTQTASMVNYDAILDSFGAPQRSALQHLITESAQVYAGSGGRAFNEMLAKLNPAAAQLDGLTGELSGDRVAIANVIRTGSVSSTAIASRSADLTAAVANTAATMHALAQERGTLADALNRAPSVLDQARTTLAKAGTAVRALGPALREVPPAAAPVRRFLRLVDTTAPAATPVVTQLRHELPALRASLTGLVPLGRPAVRALKSAGGALDGARPIVQAARYYGSDLLLGVFQGLIGVAVANYDRWGHYARLEFAQPYQTLLGGPLSSLLAKPLLPSLFDLRTRLLRRCPGGNAPPAPDGSSPWVLPSSICTASDDVPLSVDFP